MTVFLSSTLGNLRRYRNAVTKALRKAFHDVVNEKSYIPSGDSLSNKLKMLIDGANVFVVKFVGLEPAEWIVPELKSIEAAAESVTA